MSAIKKFTDDELKMITKQAIDSLDPNHLFLVKVKNTDVLAYAVSRFPNFKKPDAYKAAVNEVLDEYNNNRSKYVERTKNSGDRTRINYMTSFNAEVFFDTYKSDGKKMLQALKLLEKNIREQQSVSEQTSDMLKKANERIQELSSSKNDTSLYLEHYKKLEEMNQKLKSENEEYRKTLEEIETMAGLMVIKDCHMGVVSIEDNPRARALTYLDTSKRKKELMNFFSKTEETIND